MHTQQSNRTLTVNKNVVLCLCSGLGTEGCLPCFHLSEEISPMWDKFCNTAVKKLSGNLLAKWIVLIFFT